MSAIQNAPVQFQPPTALNTDFGHSPTGKLGERTVELGKPSFPRAVKHAFENLGSKFKGLAGRIAESRKPAQERAGNAFEKSLRKTSEKVGDLLGSLSKTGTHKVDGFAFKKALDDLGDASQEIRDQGANYTEVLTARLEVNLGKMTTKELLNLHEGVLMAETSVLKDSESTASHLDLIKSSVSQHLDARLRSSLENEVMPFIKEALDALPNEKSSPGTVNESFQAALSKTADLIRTYGLTPPDGRDGMNKLQHTLLKAAIEPGIQLGNATTLNVGRMLGVIPTENLHTLAHCDPLPGHEIATTMERLTMGAIGVRMEQLEAGLLKGVESILARSVSGCAEDPGGPILDPHGFASTVIDVAKNMRLMGEHAEVHDLRTEEGTSEKVAAMLNHLQELMKPSNQISLGELSLPRLRELSDALNFLGNDRADVKIQSEITARRDTAVRGYEQTLGEILGALKSGDQKLLLEKLQVLHQQATVAAEASEALGRKINDPDKIRAFKKELLTGALSKLGQDDQIALQGALISHELHTLRDGLAALGSALLSRAELNSDGSRTGLGSALMDANLNLGLIEEVTRETLSGQGINLPPLPDQETDYGSAGLSDVSRRAILEVYGVAPTSDNEGVVVKSGLVTSTAQSMFEQILLAPLSETEKEEHTLPSGLGTGVGGPFWRDLPRATYRIETPEGELVPIVNRSLLSTLKGPEKDVQMLAGVDKLRELVGGDEERLLQISQYIHQGTLAGLEMAANSSHSPMRLPDGSPGRLQGKESTTYTLSDDGDGNILVKIDYSISGGHTFHNAETGERTWLKSDKSSAAFSLELTFTQDGKILVSQPVSFTCDVEVDPEWNKDYPRPHDIFDIVGGNTNLRDDFAKFAARQQFSEALSFMQEHREFAKNPTLEGARTLMNRFVGADSEFNVTFDDDPMVQRVRDTLNGPQADTLTAQQLLEVFESAVTNASEMLRPRVTAFALAAIQGTL